MFYFHKIILKSHLVEQMLFVVVVVDKLVEQMDVKHLLVFLLDIFEQKVVVVVQD